MVKNNSEPKSNHKLFYGGGVILAISLYIGSIYHELFLTGNTSILEPGVKTIAIAHWNLEDGFREGFEDMIESFEALKAHEFDRVVMLFENRKANDFKRLVLEYLALDKQKNEKKFIAEVQKFESGFKPNYQVTLATISQIKMDKLMAGENIPAEKLSAEQYKEYVWIMKYIERILAQERAKEFIEQVNDFDKSRKRESDWTQSVMNYVRLNTKKEKVKVIQSTVAFRGYSQWFTTQLIGKRAADILMFRDDLGGDTPYKYFNSIASEITRKNEYNVGTPLENFAWKDTFIDGLAGEMDFTYVDYFSVGTFFHTVRLFVNLELLEKTTGSRKLPDDLSEWMDMCEKIKKYSQSTGELIIPIGVRGIDKMTLRILFDWYSSQVCGKLNDIADKWFTAGEIYGSDDRGELLRFLRTDPEFKERMLAAVDIIREIGQYFGDGFTATDQDQTRFQFCSGRTVFLTEITAGGYSLVRNSPFEVGITIIPPLGNKHKYSKYFTGEVTESGVKVSGNFGIPKSSKNFDLALDMLKYMTSYEINQMTMGRAKWPPVVKQAVFTGILKKFEPVMEGNQRVRNPFFNAQASRVKTIEWLEDIIVKNINNPQAVFADKFKKEIGIWIEECVNDREDALRSLIDKEMQRTQVSLALEFGNPSEPEARKFLVREYMAAETNAIVSGPSLSTRFYEELKKCGETQW